MSINITSNGSISHNPALDVKSPALKPITEPRPRDNRGRFTSPEAKEQILENARKLNEKEVKQLKSLYMNEVEWTAPYIYNFVKDNGVVKALIEDGDLRGCLYLNKDTESYYLFFTPHSSFGFHLSCGILSEVLNNEDTVKLVSEYDILYWDAIQKA